VHLHYQTCVAALADLPERTQCRQHIIAFDKHVQSKRYTALTADEVASLILRPTVLPSYTLIGAGPVHFFADIDLPYTAEGSETFLNVIGALQLMSANCGVTELYIYTCQRSCKTGIHLHADTQFPDVEHLKASILLHDTNRLCDLCVYGVNRCFRLPYAPKGNPTSAPGYIPYGATPVGFHRSFLINVNCYTPFSHDQAGSGHVPSVARRYVTTYSTFSHEQHLKLQTLFRELCRQRGCNEVFEVFEVTVETHGNNHKLVRVRGRQLPGFCLVSKTYHTNTHTEFLLFLQGIFIHCRANNGCKNRESDGKLTLWTTIQSVQKEDFFPPE
jgi:hypothetical protein